MRPLLRTPTTLAPTLFLLAAGCHGAATTTADGAATTSDPTEDPAPVLPRGTSVFLEIVTPAGAPVPRARVFLYGQDPGAPDGGEAVPVPLERLADGAGHLLLDELIPGRVIARVDAPGYATASLVLGLDNGVQTGARVTMLPLGEPIVFQAREGAVLRREDIRVDILPDAFVDADGQPVTGLVEATLTPFDPSRGLDGLPWRLDGLRSPDNNNAAVRLKTLYMADISVWQGGRHLQLAPGKTARVEFVLPETFGDRRMSEVFAAGDLIPSWYYDFEVGAWREEAVGAIVEADQPGRLAWVVDIEHFSPHNCDVPVPPPQLKCVLVTVFDELDEPQPGVHVQLDGTLIDDDAVTDANGRACLLGEVGDHVVVYAGTKPNKLSELYELDLLGPAAACGSESCEELGILVDGKGPVCTPGEQINCPYGGDPDQEGIGECAAPTNFCGVEGEWLGCAGQVLPSDEVCDTPTIDEDCDGEPDEGPQDCQCVDNDTQPCFPFDAVIQGQCKSGEQLCIGGQWGQCTGEQGPAPEDCATLSLDEDCDGNPGCGLAAWSDGGLGDGALQTLVDVAVGPKNSIYVAGRTAGQVDLGNGLIVKEPGVFLARYTNGTPTWVLPLGPAWVGELDIDVSADDRLVLAGTLSGASKALGINCPGTGGLDPDLALAQFDGMSSECVQMRRFVHPGAQHITGLTVDGNDRFVAGLYAGAPSLDGQTLPKPGSPDPTDSDAFVARLDDQLHCIWAEQLPAGLDANDPRGPAVAVNAAAVFVAGAFAGTVKYAGVSTPANGSSDLFLVRHERLTGSHQWLKTYGNAQSEPGLVSLATDPAGDILFSGTVIGEVDLSVDAAVGLAGQQTVFVAKLGQAGEHRWSTTRALGAPAALTGGQQLAVDNSGRIVLVGRTTQNPPDLFTLKLSPKGAVHWERTHGGPGTQLGASIAIDRFNQTDAPWLVGWFDQDFSIDAQLFALNEPGDPGDGFLVRLDP